MTDNKQEYWQRKDRETPVWSHVEKPYKKIETVFVLFKILSVIRKGHSSSVVPVVVIYCVIVIFIITSINNSIIKRTHQPAASNFVVCLLVLFCFVYVCCFYVSIFHSTLKKNYITLFQSTQNALILIDSEYMKFKVCNIIIISLSSDHSNCLRGLINK